VRGESFDCYCLSLGYRERKKTVDPSDLFKDIIIDPPHAFMKRFADRKAVYKASLCRENVLEDGTVGISVFPERVVVRL
jgi:hypothetical protein